MVWDSSYLYKKKKKNPNLTYQLISEMRRRIPRITSSCKAETVVDDQLNLIPAMIFLSLR